MTRGEHTLTPVELEAIMDRNSDSFNQLQVRNSVGMSTLPVVNDLLTVCKALYRLQTELMMFKNDLQHTKPCEPYVYTHRLNCMLEGYF